jgi:prepilin-type N-terminal cleavage/methylation domain-containing protein
MRCLEEQRMKRENGFSLIELMVAMVILIAITSAAVAALVQAQNTTNSIAQEANTQENLRAGMHFLVRDLMQAGEGIPSVGISIPNTAGGTSAVIRPGIGGVFPNNPTAFSVIVPGSGWGAAATTVNPLTAAVLVGGPTDTITIFYADNGLLSSANCTATAAPCPLNSAPVTSAAAPVCTGVIAATGLTVTLAPGCFQLPGTPTPIQQGDLIMFQNINGTAVEMVTNVNAGGDILTFSAGDPGGLNATGDPNGTVAAINASAVPTVIARVWMITYYINTATNPSEPQLIRQVNYPGYPAAVPTYPPQQIADATEWLNFTYDIINSTDPAGTYPNGPGDAPTPQLPDTAFQIRAVNVLLGGRSEHPLVSGSSRQYFRNNLSTQVSIRSLSFVNQFNASATAPD